MSAPMWRKPSRPSRQLSGHGLLNEGAAFDSNGRRIERGTAGVGYALCSCGAKSAVLTSGGLRRAWHRNHKDEIRAAKA